MGSIIDSNGYGRQRRGIDVKFPINLGTGRHGHRVDHQQQQRAG
jgi:hypothetical protein